MVLASACTNELPRSALDGSDDLQLLQVTGLRAEGGGLSLREAVGCEVRDSTLPSDSSVLSLRLHTCIHLTEDQLVRMEAGLLGLPLQ